LIKSFGLQFVFVYLCHNRERNRKINILFFKKYRDMKNLDYTGLDAKKVEKVVKELSQLLADFQVYYANLRGFHWNVKGDKFYQLHEYYEGQYNDAAAKVDEVAERLLQLDARPENRFSEYLKQSQLKEAGFEPEKMEGLKYILDTLKVIIAQERRVLAAAQEAEDEVTVALMDDYLTGQEKNVWMLVATLS